MHIEESNTCRPACRLRRQVSSEPPAKGSSCHRIAAVQFSGKLQDRTAHLRGERIPAGVSWAEPGEKPPSGLANAAHQSCSFGVGHRMPMRSSGPRSRCWWGSVPPGPAVVLSEVPAINGQRGKRQLTLPWVSRAEEPTLILPCQNLGSKDRFALESRSVPVSRYETADKSTRKHPSATDC